MAMTRKDFALIAQTIAREVELSTAMFEPHHVDAYAEIARKLADQFAQLNPRFSRQAFLQAAGVANLSTVDKTNWS